ncbi:hypothetical protein BRADI_3g06807v3 [Brachypodium distachyon]|uniref:Uncharacterized protein n=1 Tax=Brachypodium distachyon TaxID=15368 RepID=A0A2K2CVM2_BRADI|nr:hypothetical protein BRADI_3g06807v3 [Brachypodium distachyon]
MGAATCKCVHEGSLWLPILDRPDDRAEAESGIHECPAALPVCASDVDTLGTLIQRASTECSRALMDTAFRFCFIACKVYMHPLLYCIPLAEHIENLEGMDMIDVGPLI